MRKSGTIQRHSSLLCNQKQKAKRHLIYAYKERKKQAKRQKKKKFKLQPENFGNKVLITSK